MGKYKYNWKLNRQELVDNIVEMYCYFFRQCRTLEADSPDYYKAVGAHEALGAVARQVLGQKQLTRIWQELSEMGVREKE